MDWEKTNPNEPKRTQFAGRAKLMQSLYLQRIMKKNTAKGYKKTNPKQTQFTKSQQMNANSFLAKDYAKNRPFRPRENKPKTNPICGKLKMNATVYDKTNYKNPALRGINPISTPTCPHRPARAHRHSRTFRPKIFVYPSYILQISLNIDTIVDRSIVRVAPGRTVEGLTCPAVAPGLFDMKSDIDGVAKCRYFAHRKIP